MAETSLREQLEGEKKKNKALRHQLNEAKAIAVLDKKALEQLKNETRELEKEMGLLKDENRRLKDFENKFNTAQAKAEAYKELIIEALCS